MCDPGAGQQILGDLHAAVAGALELLKADQAAAPTDRIAFAENLLAQAADRCATLREVLRAT
jgi:hypothetical protein